MEPLTYVLVPGAGGNAWTWHRVEPLLRAHGHDVVAVELPADDDTAGLDRYADTVVAAAGDRAGMVLVAGSMGSYAATMACARLPVRGLVLLNAMIPAPGETAGDWWAATGQPDAERDLHRRAGRDPDADHDLRTMFFHDVPPEITEVALATGKPQSGRPFADPWPLTAWPDVPTRVLSSTDDRLFPVGFQDRVARDRLGITPEHLPGGHLVALSRPAELTATLRGTGRWPWTG